MEISKSFINRNFPVAIYKGRMVLREGDETFNEVMGNAQKQIDADIEAEIRAVVEKVLRERESR